MPAINKNTSPDSPLAVVCPLLAEARPLLDAFTVINRELLGRNRVYQLRHDKRQLWLIVSGMGKKKAARAAENLIRHCAPRLLINFGTAGGLDPELGVGETVVSSHVVAYDCEPPLIYSGDEFLRQRALLVPGVKEGIIASAEQDVNSQKEREYVRQKYQAVCCDWESAAVLDVAQNHGVPAVALRVISDVGDNRPLLEEFKSNLPGVVEMGGRVMLEFLRKL